MNKALIVDTALHWAAVIIYAIATVVNVYGLIFKKDRAERISYFIILSGLLVHGIALIYRWTVAGHGPYIVRYEVLSSNAWIALFLFLVFVRKFPKIKPASIFVFPSTFLLIALGLFFNPEVRKLPPSLKKHMACAACYVLQDRPRDNTHSPRFFSFLYHEKRTKIGWLDKLPDIETVDIYAYRFAGFGFVFWAIATLAGSIWAYQSWGRFWGWGPVETWSLITWVFFGLYLHLRRFFGWRGEKAAYFYMACFVLSLLSIFFTPLIESSIHSEYFR